MRLLQLSISDYFRSSILKMMLLFMCRIVVIREYIHNKALHGHGGMGYRQTSDRKKNTKQTPVTPYTQKSK